ncbi:transposon tf2-1, partial [Cystoisospora suis]
MDDDVAVFVQACVACARGKNVYLRAEGLLQPLPVPSAPWEDIALDLIVGLPQTATQHDAIVTAICRLTKMAHFVPSKQSATAEDLACIL